jgi:hypothetical protein
VAPGTILPKQATVLRGKVNTREGLPLSGVRITVLHHAEFGSTLSRIDGAFDMAANGGKLLAVSYEKSGFIPIQRQVYAPWQDYVLLPDVEMIPFDTQVTAIDLNSGALVQVAQGSLVTDADGSRRASLLFSGGTTANMEMANGAIQPLNNLHVRASEYTIGPDGPAAMPAVLPAQSMYTYAVELSVDEAVAAAVEHRSKQQGENHAPDPPGNWGPWKAQIGVRQKLKEEQTDCCEDGAGKKEAGAENQGDAILGSLEANEGDGREDESEKAADDLEVTLEKRIRFDGNATQPIGGSDDKEEASSMREENRRATAAMLERCLGHNPFFQNAMVPRAGAYLIRLLSSLGRCHRTKERVSEEIPSCGFRDLYKSAG